jgi:hypothetical protein
VAFAAGISFSRADNSVLTAPQFQTRRTTQINALPEITLIANNPQANAHRK